MSLRAKIEAVIYAADEPVTLAQLAAIFATELPVNSAPASESDPGEQPTAESLLEQGFLQATPLEAADGELAEIAILTGLEDREKSDSVAVAETMEEGTPSLTTAPSSTRVGLTGPSEAAAAEAEARRAARQRDREVRDQLKEIVDSLIEEYATSDRGMEIREVASGYRIATKPEYHDAVRSFVKSLKPAMKLSLQALETLAVIAYKQPVTAPEVGEIRGVESGGVLGTLVSRKLITTAGRKQVIGRPILYKTTREFLLRFGLKDIHELPSIEEFEKLAGDIELSEEETAPEETTLPFDSGEGENPEEAIDLGAPSLTTAPSSTRVGLTDPSVEESAEEKIQSPEQSPEQSNGQAAPIEEKEQDHARTS